MARGLNGSDSSTEAVTRRMRLLVLAALLCAAQFYLNRPVLAHDWVYFDDDINIVLNPHLTGGSAETWHWAWTDSSYNRRYMPLGWLMFDSLFRLGGLNPAVYHAASWLLSSANTVLLFCIVRRFLQLRQQTKNVTAWQDASAALAVILLSAHPLRAELAGWASGLLYLGSTFLASLAVLASFPLAPRRVATEWLGRLLFLSSLLLYPVQVGLPLLLMIAAACVPSATTRSALLAALRQAALRYASWLLLALAVGSWNIYAAATSSTFTSPGAIESYPLGARLAQSVAMLGHYGAQLAWPSVTSPFYGDLGAMPVMHRLVLPLVMAGTFSFALIWSRTRFSAAACLVTLLAAVLPFAGLLDRGQGASDRYTFLLLAVVTTLVAGLLARISHSPGRLVAALGLLAVTICILPAYHRSLAAWRTTETLQAQIDRATGVRPDVRLGFSRPATTGFLRGRYRESQERLRRGFSVFGAHPDLIGAATFIEETRTSLTGDARNPVMPPYSYMHLDLARKHRAAGHAHAAEAHERYARQIMLQADSAH